MLNFGNVKNLGYKSDENQSQTDKVPMNIKHKIQHGSLEIESHKASIEIDYQVQNVSSNTEQKEIEDLKLKDNSSKLEAHESDDVKNVEKLHFQTDNNQNTSLLIAPKKSEESTIEQRSLELEIQDGDNDQNKKTFQSHMDEVPMKIEPQVQNRSLEIEQKKSELPEVDEKHLFTKEIVIESKVIEKNTKLVSCGFCRKTFTQRFSLKIHETIHIGEKISCKFCDRTFKCKYKVKVHERIHTGEGLFSCEFCEKTFTNGYAAKKHKSIHSEERPFSCEICEKTFKRKDLLRLHKQKHIDVKPFLCDFCEKTFRLKVNLQTHQRIHTGERPFSCKNCGKTFTMSNSLKNHEKRHIMKTFSCKNCQKVFNTYSDKINHEQIHTSKKPYECKICKKSYGRLDTLKDHQRHHTGNTFSCQLCPEKFTQPNQLKKHICNNEKSFWCSKCHKPKGFKTSKLLKKHENESHMIK